MSCRRELAAGIEPRGVEAGAKLGLRHGLELGGVAQLLHERLRAPRASH